MNNCNCSIQKRNPPLHWPKPNNIGLETTNYNIRQANEAISDNALGKCAFLQTGDDLRALPACLFLLFFLQGQVQKPKHNSFCAMWHYLYCRAKPSIIFLIYGRIKKCPPPYTVQFTTVRTRPWLSNLL